jgi:hypothetical protein
LPCHSFLSATRGSGAIRRGLVPADFGALLLVVQSQGKQQRSPRKVRHAAGATSAAKQGDSALSGPAEPAKIASSPGKKKSGSQDGLKPWTTGSSPGGKRRPVAEAEAAAAVKSPSTPRTPPRLRKSPHKGSPRKDHSKYFLDLQPQNGACIFPFCAATAAYGRTLVHGVSNWFAGCRVLGLVGRCQSTLPP